MSEAWWFFIGVLLLGFGFIGIVIAADVSRSRKLYKDFAQRSTFFHQNDGCWVIRERLQGRERWSKGGFYEKEDAEAALWADHEWGEWF